MDKSYTILVVPDRDAKVKKIRVEHRVLVRRVSVEQRELMREQRGAIGRHLAASSERERRRPLLVAVIAAHELVPKKDKP